MKVKGVYHYHVRKTAGTSINKMFIESLFGINEGHYDGLTGMSKTINGYRITGWDFKDIENCNSHYGWSHVPFEQIHFKCDDIYTITCFRDPVDRFMSYFNMLWYHVKTNTRPDIVNSECRRLVEDPVEFAKIIENKSHLYTQIGMYSSSFDINKAYDNVSKVSTIIFTNNFNDDISKLSDNIGVDLEPMYDRKMSYDYIKKDYNRQNLKDILNNEYIFLEKVKNNLHK